MGQMIDNMYQYIQNETKCEPKILEKLHKYLQEEEFDSDAIQADLFDQNQSNIQKANSNKVIDSMNNVIKKSRLSSTSFSTGFVFFYWEFCRHLSQKEIAQMESTQWQSSSDNPNQYTAVGLYVNKFYDSLKQEILSS
eukprot:250154_1